MKDASACRDPGELQKAGLASGIAIPCVVSGTLVLFGVLLHLGPQALDVTQAPQPCLKSRKGASPRWVPRKVYRTDSSASLRFQTREEIKLSQDIFRHGGYFCKCL